MKNKILLIFFLLATALMLTITPAAASPSTEDLIDAGFIALESGNSKMAGDLFARAAATTNGKNSPSAWAGLGRAIWNESSSENTDSYNAFLRSLAIEDADAKEWKTVCEILFSEPVEDFQLSYSAALKAVEADKNDDQAWNYLGCALDRLAAKNPDADLNEPFEAFKKANFLNPTLLYSSNEAYYAIVVENYTYAIDAANKAFEKYNPDKWWKGQLLFLKAYALAKTGESEDALKTLALSKDAYNSDESYEMTEYDNASAAFVRAVALNDLGRFDESAEILERADFENLDTLFPGLLITPKMYMDLYGACLSGLGKIDEAADAFLKSV